MLEIGEIGLVLTAGRLSARVDAELGAAVETIALPGKLGQETGVRGGVARRSSVAGRDDLAVMILTAGSSGDPKLVMLTHGNLLSNAASIIEYLKIRPADRALALLPFHHAFGHSVFQTHLLSGATLVQAGSVLFPNSIVAAIKQHGATSFSGVPEMHRMLLSRSDLGQTPLASLRYMAVAGGAMAPQLAAEVARRIAPAAFYVMYGQTEACARISYLEPAELERRWGSIGRGIPGVEVQVVDPLGSPVKPGEVGELRARGPNVMVGYRGAPTETGRVIREGWLYTGDLATVDQDGYVYIRGRASELIKVSGYRLHPAEVEAVIAERLPVQNVVVVGCNTGNLDTRLAMFVERSPRSGQLTTGDVLAICRDELPRHKIPAFVEILDRLPLNRAMKVDRAALRRRGAEGLTAADQSLHPSTVQRGEKRVVGSSDESSTSLRERRGG